MRIALTGVAHWHTPFYVEPVLARAGAEIVGVADPLEAAASGWGKRLGVPHDTDYRALIERVRPDFVVALGRHDEMAAVAEHLILADLPFAMEKPCGRNLAEVERVAALAADRGTFAAVAFSYRNSRLVELIREHSPGQELSYGSFKYIAGLTSRYPAYDYDASWMLDPAVSGGGCTINLAVHFFDLLALLAPNEPWRVTAASMSSRLSGAAVEDYSFVTLESGDRTALVETGYAFPGRAGLVDLGMSIVVGTDYYRCIELDTIAVKDADGNEERYEAATKQTPYYPAWVDETLDRFEAGSAPATGLPEMLAAARLTEEAYRLAGRSVA